MASKVTRDGVTLSWEKPTYDGGSPILGYLVEKRFVRSFLFVFCGCLFFPSFFVIFFFFYTLGIFVSSISISITCDSMIPFFFVLSPKIVVVVVVDASGVN